jgi:hypothetical protein
MRETSAVYDKDPKKQLIKEEKRATKLLKGGVVKRFADTEKKKSLLNLKTA